jgi:hypothetical protein
VRERLAAAEAAEHADWEQIRARLRQTVGESTFEIWLAPLELIAVGPGGGLLVDAPDATRSWVQTRFGRLLGRCATEAGRAIRFAEELERLALEPQPNVASPGASRGERDGGGVRTDVTASGARPSVSPASAGARLVDRSFDESSSLASDKSDDWQASGSADELPFQWTYTHVYTGRRVP